MTDLPLDEPEVVAPTGGIASKLDSTILADLGSRVVEDYERDRASRAEWEDKARRALDRAAQEDVQAKDYPWQGASNVNYPMLTVAALQFQARAYPAIVKNDEAVQVKVFGAPVDPDPQVLQMAMQQPQSPEQAQAVQQAQMALAEVQEARARRRSKQRRAERVSTYLNYKLFYEIEGWESDTDSLLLQLPIVGCGFRKTWYAEAGCRSVYVPAMRLIVNQDARNLETAPRVTEEIPDVYPYQVRQRIASGLYRDVDLVATGDDDQAPRLLLEQYRLDDLDGDGLEEPYVVTVDKETQEVLRIELGGWPTGAGFERFMPYTKYEFLPDPKGRFYSIGFGHLLDQITDVVNTSINQLVDAGHAQIAGGGFIAAGVRLQGNGQTNVLRFRPAEYKLVNVAPGQLQGSIYERTFPGPSPVAFQMLDLMLGAVKDITSTSDVITGDAPSTAPVGTTLALIEQGLQVFTAIYKRIYRALKGEFRDLYDTVGRYGDPAEYLEVVDDPEADFAADFSPEGRDILPVSDPSVATRMQAMAKAQILLSMTGRGLNDREIYLRAFRSFDIDDPEDLVPPAAPPPGAEEAAMQAQARAQREQAGAVKDMAMAEKYAAEAEGKRIENGYADFGGVRGLALAPFDPMGAGGDAPGLGGPEIGVVGPFVAGG